MIFEGFDDNEDEDQTVKDILSKIGTKVDNINIKQLLNNDGALSGHQIMNDDEQLRH